MKARCSHHQRFALSCSRRKLFYCQMLQETHVAFLKISASSSMLKVKQTPSSVMICLKYSLQGINSFFNLQNKTVSFNGSARDSKVETIWSSFSMLLRVPLNKCLSQTCARASSRCSSSVVMFSLRPVFAKSQFLVKSKSDFKAFVSGQIVTAGNGICQTGVDLSPELMMTDDCCHLS